MRRDPAFDPGHGSAPQIGHVGQDELGVALAERCRAAVQALLLFRLADQPVPLVAPVAYHLAGGGAAKALLRAALGLELGHFCVLGKRYGGKACPMALSRGPPPVEAAGYSDGFRRKQGAVVIRPGLVRAAGEPSSETRCTGARRRRSSRRSSRPR